MKKRLVPLVAGLVLAAGLRLSAAEPEPARDLVIYGGTSGGLVAGFQALAMGRTVVVIEPSRHLGGLTTGGLGQTDIGNKQVIGGLAREFYRRIARHYARPEAWKWQERKAYQGVGQSATASGEATQWTFEPSAAARVFQEWIAETGLEVVCGERLDRQSGVKKSGARIVSITMESGRTFPGAMFIDATYEGDLFAAAGVSYTVGREANAPYGETLNGVQTAQAKHHNLVAGVDPYVVPGKPESGLLPGIDPEGPGPEGAGDKRVQAYNFRMCLTDHPENRLPFHRPEGYDERPYELLFRNYEAGFKEIPWNNSPMPNRKTDTNNGKGVSTDFIGQNYDYPEASYAERERIVARHRQYQQGLMWTLANHPRIPEAIRREVSRWGVTRDEFPEGQGWPDQIYVREARRMVSDYVMTQHHCQGRAYAEDSVGMGAYTMYSHHVQRYVTADGHVRNEGDVQVGGFPPYPISYRAIRPKKEECENLLVPFGLSATHIAFGSIRMEPVFMVLGQSAATAACLALEASGTVQDVDYEKLRARLRADRQVLETRPPPTLLRPERLEGIVVDDHEAGLEGVWVDSTVIRGVGRGYRHDGARADGQSAAVFRAKLPKAGRYEVQVAYVANPNRATNVPVTIETANGKETRRLNQRAPPSIRDMFASLGVFPFDLEAVVRIRNEKTDGHVIIDAVRFVPVE